MSKYTTEVRFICENFAGLTESVGYNNVEEVLEKSWRNVFNFDFPIFDEAYRSILCKKILKHYYTQEIGVETVGLWQLRLNAKLNEIMPYYNKLYNAWKEDFNPLHDTDLERKHLLTRTEKEGINQTGNTETSAHSESVNKDKYSDTPQGGLSGVESDQYLTNARIVNAESDDTGISDYTQDSNRDLKSSDEYVEQLTGKSSGGSFSDMLIKYREALINIDMLVIGELENLFMLIW